MANIRTDRPEILHINSLVRDSNRRSRTTGAGVDRWQLLQRSLAGTITPCIHLRSRRMTKTSCDRLSVVIEDKAFKRDCD